MEEKIIKWKLIKHKNFTDRFFMYFELNINSILIQKLIEDGKIRRYNSFAGKGIGSGKAKLFAKYIGRKIMPADLDEYIFKYKECEYVNKKIIFLSSYYRTKYPPSSKILSGFRTSYYNNIIAVEDENDLEDEIDRICKTGYLYSSEIECPKEIDNFLGIAVYLWKNT